MKYLQYCILALLWPVMNGLAQSSPKIHSINIGDKIPDILLTNMYNYPTTSLHLSTLKGKLIILDFWSTWCGSCIEAFPKMHRLQKEFDGQIQVILVNAYKTDDIKKVKPFFENHTMDNGAEISLPYSLLQVLMKQYFPFRFIPHYVWINQTGEVVAMTSQLEVNKENITNVLAGQPVLFHEKNDQLQFIKEKPLFINGNGGDEKGMVYRSVFTHYIEGLGNATGMDTDTSQLITRFYMLNASPLMFLATAYPGCLAYPANRIIIEARDKEQFAFLTATDTAIYKKEYCYEITIPPSTLNDLLGFIQQDIYRTFQVTVKNQVRNMDCLILKKMGDKSVLLNHGEPSTMELRANNHHKFIHNEPFETLLNVLNGMAVMRGTPIVDDTGLKDNITIDLPDNFADLSKESLIDFLKRAGFESEINNREIKVAVITNDRP